MYNYEESFKINIYNSSNLDFIANDSCEKGPKGICRQKEYYTDIGDICKVEHFNMCA